jgi:hypothetical protein
MKNKNTKTIFFLIVLLSSAYLKNDIHGNVGNAITYRLNGGRLGDCLYTYIKALWISHNYDMPLLYKPFAGSEEFSFDTYHEKFNNKTTLQYKKNISITDSKHLEKEFSDTLFTCSIYYEDPSWTKNSITNLRRNKPFLEVLKKHLTPKKHPILLQLPKNKFTVALHVRRGGGFDSPLLMQQADRIGKKLKNFADGNLPLKFPPDSYYIEQLRKIQALYPEKQIYIYIFTDDPNPAAIARTFSHDLDMELLEFDYRKNDNRYNKNLIEDMFAMTKFDCLIRTQSAFSQMAHLLGDHKIVYWPDEYLWDSSNTLYITKTIVDIYA